jgi:hypothetical protein
MSIIAGDLRKKSVIRKWYTLTSYDVNNVITQSDRIYIVRQNHVSTNIVVDELAGKIEKLDRRFVASGIRDIGPFVAAAGYRMTNTVFPSINARDTGARYSDHSVNEVVVGFRPIALNSDNGGWSDGGRVTVRFGFYLRLQKINRVD